MGSLAGAAAAQSETRTMKFLLLLVATAALAHDDERQMFKTWAKKKALESCWGEDNMKTYTVNMKKAVAKCTQQDAPELELPIFRSMDKFVNVLVSFAHEKQEDNMEEMVQMMKMMQIMNKYKQSHHDSHDYSSYSGYNKKSDSFAPIMEYMMKNKMDHHQSYNNEYAMKDESQPWMEMMKKMMSGEQDMRRENPFEDMMTSRSDYGSMQSRSDPEHDMDMGMFQKMMKFMTNMPVRPARDNMDNKYQKMASLMHHYRSKRQTARQGDALALNDRLKEKIQAVAEEGKAKVGNMTCVLREMNCLDEDNNIDIRAMKEDMKQYSLPSQWFSDKYEEILDTCYEVATNLPAKLDKQNIIEGDFGTVNLGRIKSFMGCCDKAKMKLCMHQDIKTKIETNFGPVDEILASFDTGR